ncbi:MAG TPA: VOC family protein, partial [Jatrophihabitans sp.]|nr:VOC family protein [Jatrophihabitans sp.]
MIDDTLSRPVASAAVEATGWRLLLGSFAASVPVGSVRQALEVATTAAEACGEHANGHLRADVRADRVELVVQTEAARDVTALDAELVARITAAVRELGCSIAAPNGNSSARPVQQLEIAIDTLDRARIKPFWAAALALVGGLSADELVDPAGQLSTVWFQDMDEPRPQRNRIH